MQQTKTQEMKNESSMYFKKRGQKHLLSSGRVAFYASNETQQILKYNSREMSAVQRNAESRENVPKQTTIASQKDGSLFYGHPRRSTQSRTILEATRTT